MSLNYTPLRHKMLAEASRYLPDEHYLALYCSNQKRAIWRPVRLDLDVEVRLSAAESRAVSDLWGNDLLDTPYWQGDMDVYRVLRLTEAGTSTLKAWTAFLGEPS